MKKVNLWLTLTYFILGDLSLPRAFKPINLGITFHEVLLADPTIDPFSPASKAAFF
jgi:hypothetical protein